MNDTDDTIRAKILSTMERRGFYKPARYAKVDNLPNYVGVEAHNQGRVKDLVAAMAGEDAEPIVWHMPGETVWLEKDSDGWVRARIRFHDADQLTGAEDLRIVDTD